MEYVEIIEISNKTAYEMSYQLVTISEQVVELLQRFEENADYEYIDAVLRLSGDILELADKNVKTYRIQSENIDRVHEILEGLDEVH